MTLEIAAMTRAWADAVTGWRHPPPYDTYDVLPDEEHDLLVPELRYHVVLEDGELIGYCCFGEDAQVEGGTYPEGELSVGWGLRPDLMGHGRGAAFADAILGYAEEAYRPASLGLTIAEFNARSRRVAEHAGFVADGPRFTGPDGMIFRCYRRASSATGPQPS